MSTIRVVCQSCGTKFRSSKLGFDKYPVPPADVRDNEGFVKQRKGSVFPGVRTPRHTLCRPCFKAQNHRARPINRSK